MQETPPVSIAEIRMRLAQYLDGALSPDEEVALNRLLEQFPSYRAELARLQQSRDTVRESMARTLENNVIAGASDILSAELPTGQDFWKTIEGRLQADARQEAIEPDPEFISAYYDSEIPVTDPALRAFEAQLYGNADANRLLAEIGEVSEAVRQFGYRLESACTLDIARDVVMAFQAEQASSTASPEKVEETLSIAWPSGLNEVQTCVLSAYVDQALSARETIEANRLIESRNEAKALVSRFNWLSERIQSVSTQLQAQAPDLAASVRAQYEKELAESRAVLPFYRRQKVQTAFRIALPVAAAAILILVSMPALQMNKNGLSAPNHAISDVANASNRNATNLAIQPVSDQTNAGGPEIASLPMGGGAMGDRAQQLLQASPQASTDDVSLDRAISKRPLLMPLKPMLEVAPSPVAMQSPDSPTSPATMNDATDRPHTKSPSSEEYLFSALNEKNSDEDVSNMLGN